jgi:transcription factor IIIB subunit 2
VSDSAEIDAAEFESDPEVANCLLSAAEVEIKERIWVHENRDYLRTQQAKALKRALQEGEGNGNVKRPRKRRKGRIGDVGYLNDKDGRHSRASSAVEAVQMMLEQRAPSNKIDYKKLLDLYGEEEKTEGERSSRSQSVTSEATQGPLPGTAGENNKPGASSTEKEKTGGFNEADYDDEDDEMASDKGYDDDQEDIDNAFAGEYEDEQDYYDQASDYGD